MSQSSGRTRIIVFTNEQGKSEREIAWAELGPVVTELSELYQTVRERRVDLILVDELRVEINATVAAKLRRSHGLTEIWLVSAQTVPESRREFIDGIISRDVGQEGIDKRIHQILDDKDLLDRYQIVGRSSQIKGIARTIQRVAPTDISVMIVGASGSGKELVARALHNDSGRRSHPFVAINCGALAEGVLESELFGHEKGAFTGSVAKREGLFFKAEGGTVFLDEIGETKTDTQVKLLRVLEDGTYYPVGSSTPRRANVRVVAATNRDLTEAIAERQFREDLYFRISVVKLVLPSLYERRGDIPALLQHFWRETKISITDSALETLSRYDWPGNVRQLRNFATRMAALKPGALVEIDDVERFVTEQHAVASNVPVATGRSVEEAGQELIYRAILSLGNEVRLLRDLITAHLPSEGSIGTDVVVPAQGDETSMEAMERALIEKVLRDNRGNRKLTARKLGIGERTLYRKLTRYKLN